ncbi:MAG: FtsX-like permease family protein [Taibaiella sp.]|nr:FtsX-like permease family protein [Taibaiella sp.]
MNGSLTWQLALRYLKGKRSANAVPVLSRISMVAIAVSSAAMIIVFSVFNGFENLAKEQYKAFYPEIRISPVKGKFFAMDDSEVKKLKETKGIKNLAYVLEDNVLINSGEDQRVVTLKGIDKNYYKVNEIRQYIVLGSDTVSNGEVPTAIVGMQIANQMGMNIDNAFTRLTLYYPNEQGSYDPTNPESVVQYRILKPEGEFSVQGDFDSRYILAPLPVVQDLFKAGNKYSSVEISIDSTANMQAVEKNVKALLKSGYKVENRFEQNKTIYSVMRAEKWAIYAILVLVLVIASFNMIGALALLVLEKQKDISILKAMGADRNTIRQLFLLEGVLWSVTGGMTGIILGALVCKGQQYFRWIKLSSGDSRLQDAYPVLMKWQDFFLVIGTIIIIGLLAAWYPAVRATKAKVFDLKST